MSFPAPHGKPGKFPARPATSARVRPKFLPAWDRRDKLTSSASSGQPAYCKINCTSPETLPHRYLNRSHPSSQNSERDIAQRITRFAPLRCKQQECPINSFEHLSVDSLAALNR